MRLGIMQPYFLPWIGYFSLIESTDQFVIFDPVQYIRHGWINRNRILKPGLAEPQYIQIPLAKHARQTVIRDVTLSPNHDWKSRIFSQITHYKNRAPFYDQTRKILQNCFDVETASIVELNVHCLQTICSALEIPFHPTLHGDIDTEIEPANHASEWALHIADALGASSYINPNGGREFLFPEPFASRGIELKFLTNDLQPYPQRNAQFVPGLSIVDVLMFNDLDQTRKQITQYSLDAG